MTYAFGGPRERLRELYESWRRLLPQDGRRVRRRRRDRLETSGADDGRPNAYASTAARASWLWQPAVAASLEMHGSCSVFGPSERVTKMSLLDCQESLPWRRVWAFDGPALVYPSLGTIRWLPTLMNLTI